VGYTALQQSLPYRYSFVPTPTPCHDCHAPFTSIFLDFTPQPHLYASHTPPDLFTPSSARHSKTCDHTSFMFRVITSHSDGIIVRASQGDHGGVSSILIFHLLFLGLGNGHTFDENSGKVSKGTGYFYFLHLKHLFS
jgi:hypothetical protein